MAIINRLCCTQMPGVAILGVEGSPTVYLAHAHHLVGYLKNSMDKKASSRAFHSFCKSDAGQKLKSGGDLREAISKGPLTEMMYTYHLRAQGGGSPSLFLTISGIQKIMHGLEGANEIIKGEVRHIFSGYLQKTCFDAVTPELCAIEDEQEEIEEIYTDVPSGMVVPSSGLLEARITVAELAADKRALSAELRAKDVEMKAKDDIIKAKDEVIRARNAESAAEIAALKMAAAKDAQIMELRMQLLRAEGRGGEDGDRVHRKEQLSKNLMFPELISSLWSRETVGVNRFIEWPDQQAAIGPQDECVVPTPLSVRMAEGTAKMRYSVRSDVKHRYFGFCYKGPVITRGALQASVIFKEAYTVNVDDMHYVCLVLYHRCGRRGTCLGATIYTSNLLPTDVILEQIPGCDHQISIYKTHIPTKDPVLEMLKRPSGSKWRWSA